jgi:hypothetical protein
MAMMGVALLLSGLGGTARAADAKDAKATLDKAIKALGGEKKLSKVKAMTWKTKGKLIFGDNENEFTVETTAQGLTHIRTIFKGEFGGNEVKSVTVLAGEKGWRQVGDTTTKFNKMALANEKRTVYLQMVPITLVPLKGKGFKVAADGEEKVGGKPAVRLKITGPDGKTFTLSFDKKSGLPVKQVAKVFDIFGKEFTQVTTYADYKDFGGIKKATKLEAGRDGKTFMKAEVSGFKVLDKVDAKTFAAPD